jgi:hypothetical protein
MDREGLKHSDSQANVKRLETTRSVIECGAGANVAGAAPRLPRSSAQAMHRRGCDFIACLGPG